MALSQVLFSNVIAHLLRNLEFFIKRSRNKCAMTGLNILSLTLLGEGVRRTGEGFVGCQSNVQHEIDCHPELVSGSHEMQQQRSQSSFYKMLKQVQYDSNIPKRTYSLINLFSYSPHKKSAFTLAEGATHVVHFNDIRRVAFTLAEVLITLGIIGIVAALTLPSVITNHQKQKTVSYVKKFYNEINNAVRMAVVDNGDVELWMEDYRDDNYSANLKFLQDYILPYIKYLRVDNCYDTRVCVYLSYGMFTYRVDNNGGDIAFLVNSKYERFPKNYFAFQFNKRNNDPNLGNRPTIEPYVYGWNGDYNPPESNTLKTASWGGCNTSAGDAKYAYCTKWIQLNDWKIPDDYPWNAKE